MNISVFGLGYVGSISAACLAKNGHKVIGIDVNVMKNQSIIEGHAPVREPGLDDIILNAVESGKLHADSDVNSAVQNSDISMVCVGTPSNKNGSLDLRYVENVCQQIGTGIARKGDYHVVVVRSTVLPGTTENILIPLLEEYSGLKAGRDFGVCVNPEFLREGSGIADFYNPGLLIIGSLDQRSGKALNSMYADINADALNTSIRTAELIKYASNAFHALKVTFANEIGILGKAHGIDGRDVMDALCQDRQLNISSAYMKPGFAYGGSCLPKDLRALLYRVKERDLECSLLGAIPASNLEHLRRGIDLIESTGKKRIGILGLSFKPGTDDMRESPIVNLVERLIGKGYSIRIHDKEVELGMLVGTNKEFLEQEIPHVASLMHSSIEDVASWADVVVISHGSREFSRVKSLITDDQILIDLVGVDTSSEVIRGEYEGICW